MSVKAQLTGTVVSDKMDKTVVVAIERQVRHGVYGKIQRRTSKFVAHNEANEAKAGDTVSIAESRPLSAPQALDRRRKRRGEARGDRLVEHRLERQETRHDPDALDSGRRGQLGGPQDFGDQPDWRLDRPLRPPRRHHHRVGEGSHAGRHREEGPGRRRR